jgi:inner membrane protein
MEPVTHFLTGACLGRAGLNRKSRYVTLAAVLAAEAADIDVLWSFAGPVEELKRHRGITHTFIAVPFVAAAAVGVVALWHLWRGRRKPGAQPVSWPWVYAAALISALSHILLDWTNNYGVRPFFPFNPRWYAGSFVFIAEPVLWALLFAAILMPWLLGLTDREIGARRPAFRGRGWALFALIGMVSLWTWRWVEHARALDLLQTTQVTSVPALRTAAEPYPFNPFRWHAILETPAYFQTAEIDTHSGQIDSDSRADVLYKPAQTPAVQAAKQTPLGQVYLDWGTWAVVHDIGQTPVAGLDPPGLPKGRAWTTVQFSDLRFSYNFIGSGQSTGRSPLSGYVYIIDGAEDAGEILNGRAQK